MKRLQLGLGDTVQLGTGVGVYVSIGVGVGVGVEIAVGVGLGATVTDVFKGVALGGGEIEELAVCVDDVDSETAIAASREGVGACVDEYFVPMRAAIATRANTIP